MIMKKDIVRVGTFETWIRWSCICVIVIGMMLISTYPVNAQDTSTDTTAAPAEKAPIETTIKSKMSLTADQYPDGTITLKGLLRAKIDGAYQKIHDRKVQFFVLSADGDEKALGDSITGLDGLALIRLNKSTLSKGKDDSYSLVARFDGDEKLDGSESDLVLKSAKLVMEPRTEDSTFVLSLKATADSPKGPIPIVDAPVTIYIKRMFSSLKVAEGKTDEEGMLEIEFPKGLSGDNQGNIHITAMIEETDEFGNLTATMDQKWGYVVSSELKDNPRALWSLHPPTWMVVTFFILMGTVWTHYIIIVFKLFRIRFQKDNTHAAN